tara:strand:+ start:815 stop:1066 length:252 start_codon:yes stop_codon:yes gene_type:complete
MGFGLAASQVKRPRGRGGELQRWKPRGYHRTGQDRTGLLSYNRIRRLVCPGKSHGTTNENTKNTTEPKSSDAIGQLETKLEGS